MYTYTHTYIYIYIYVYTPLSELNYCLSIFLKNHYSGNNSFFLGGKTICK